MTERELKDRMNALLVFKQHRDHRRAFETEAKGPHWSIQVGSERFKAPHELTQHFTHRMLSALKDREATARNACIKLGVEV